VSEKIKPININEKIIVTSIQESPDASVTVNTKGEITGMNETWKKMTGINDEKAPGMLFDFFTEPLKARAAYVEILNNKFVTGIKLTIRHTNSKLTDILFNGSVYKNKDEVRGIVIVARDVTKVKATDDEFGELLEIIYTKYGYDFREYSEAHIKRRILNNMAMTGIKDISQMHHKVMNDEKFAAMLLQDMSITVTEMYRDPGFYRSMRENIIPLLKTYPFIKIWHAGCSTGEEAYSMAIMMEEEGLYDRTIIYATDFNQKALNQAKEGIFTNSMIKEYTNNYQLSGGKESFSSYYTSDHNNVIMNQSLKKNIVWANHNLVTDSVFAEVNLILCRNVIIYFNKELQNKVQTLFYNSLTNGGILALGSKESLRFTDLYNEYIEIDKKNRIFKKRY